MINIIWLVVWNILWLSIDWEWWSQLTNSYFSEGQVNHQPVVLEIDIIPWENHVVTRDYYFIWWFSLQIMVPQWISSINVDQILQFYELVWDCGSRVIWWEDGCSMTQGPGGYIYIWYMYICVFIYRNPKLGSL